jgi:ATP-dependent HslUV protease subunit HslV
MNTFKGTTVLCLRHKGEVVIAADGQVTLGNTVIKHSAKKVRKIQNNTVLTGFAGATADAFTLFERLEMKLENYKGNLRRSAVELAKDWRTDKYLRKLEAMLIAADKETSLLISGLGDVIEPDDGIIAIGSGGPFALSAAKALVNHSELNASEIANISMNIASEICIYTNKNIIIETLN